MSEEEFNSMIGELGGEGVARIRIEGWPETRYMVVRWLLGNWVQGDLYEDGKFIQEAWLMVNKHNWQQYIK